MDQTGKGPIKEAFIEATIIRADGTREELGRISGTTFSDRYGPKRLRSWFRITRANWRHRKG